MLWKILKILGVPDSLSIEVLKKLYRDHTINLRVTEKLEQFLSVSGFKQDGNLKHPSSSSLSFTQYPSLQQEMGMRNP
jgi:hypothetical protein